MARNTSTRTEKFTFSQIYRPKYKDLTEYIPDTYTTFKVRRVKQDGSCNECHFEGRLPFLAPCQATYHFLVTMRQKRVGKNSTRTVPCYTFVRLDDSYENPVELPKLDQTILKQIYQSDGYDAKEAQALVNTFKFKRGLKKCSDLEPYVRGTDLASSRGLSKYMFLKKISKLLKIWTYEELRAAINQRMMIDNIDEEDKDQYHEYLQRYALELLEILERHPEQLCCHPVIPIGPGEYTLWTRLKPIGSKSSYENIIDLTDTFKQMVRTKNIFDKQVIHGSKNLIK